MFNWFKKVIQLEEPQNTNGEIILRVDSYHPFNSGFSVKYSFIKDGKKLGNDSIHVEGDIKGIDFPRLKQRLEQFKESRRQEGFLKDLVGKSLS